MFGLPNITGGFNATNGHNDEWRDYFFADGAFFCNGGTDPNRVGNAGAGGAGGRIKLSASGSSSIFGGSSVVQPASLRALACIKF